MNPWFMVPTSSQNYILLFVTASITLRAGHQNRNGAMSRRPEMQARRFGIGTALPMDTEKELVALDVAAAYGVTNFRVSWSWVKAFKRVTNCLCVPEHVKGSSHQRISPARRAERPHDYRRLLEGWARRAQGSGGC
ncbi:hypothetical protein ON010_g7113 [Phytophthora cinnamomi]|nr:hypothetical protein ON010_g7113 [Phytophthora cinnamomi]